MKTATESQMPLVPDMVASMLEPFLFDGMKKPKTGFVWLRNGVHHEVHGVSLLKVDGYGTMDYEVVAYRPQQAGSAGHVEVRFLASSVVAVQLQGCKGLSPENAAGMHRGKSAELLDQIMSTDGKEIMGRFSDLASNCLNDTTGKFDWFRDIVQSQIDNFRSNTSNDMDIDRLKGLLTDSPENRDAPTAEMLLVVDFCYSALEDTYRPYIEESEWEDEAMQAIAKRLSDYEA